MRLPDRYRFNFRYHLAVGAMALVVLLIYWFGVLVPAHQTNRRDIWLMLLQLTVMFYVNFLKTWPWAIRDEVLKWHWVAGIVLLNLIFAVGIGLGISLQYGDLSVDFSDIGIAEIGSLFDGSVPNFYAYLLLPPLATLALSYMTFYIEWTYGPFANRKKWQRELLELRMAWRRAQLDPHLLDMHLVVLSAITRQSRIKAQQALDYTIKVVHFHIGGNDPGEKIKFVDEIESISCLREIQRIRIGEKLNWLFKIAPGLEQIEIIAMTVMVFAENQVRYAVLDCPTDAAVLEVSLQEGNLIISARNRINRVKPRHGSGTGMSNLEERLAYSYPGRVHLNSRMGGDRYEAQLTINDIFA